MIPGGSVSPWLFGTLGSLSALVLAAAWRRHALRRHWVDLPGERRLHALPTPRGGGLAILAVLLAAAPGWGENAALVAIGLLVTAGAGLIDDLRPLSPWPKFILQAVGALPLALAWPLAAAALGPWLAVAAAWCVVMALVNFWNFIDGSNGLAATQAALIAAAMLVLAGATSPAGWLALALLAGCLGFLPFNLPKARLFLGDVGSFSLGYAVAAMGLMALAASPGPGGYLLLLPSAVLLDAGLTLLRRLVRGEKFWRAHRQHLYQRAILHGWSHARICLSYSVWTVMAAVLAYLLAGQGMAGQVMGLLLVFGAGAGVHAWAGRRWPSPGSLQNDMESAG